VIDIKPKDMGKLSKLKKIVGVKDATSEIARVLEHKELCGDNFIQLSGEDETIFDFMRAGGQGCISVTANIIPNICAKFHKLLEEEKFDDAIKINNSIMPLHKVLFLETSPGPVKYALCKLGLIENTLRLPLVSVQEETKNNIDQVLSVLELI
jgi:4-hydroxy-tetrahydrodipicolinate synthase